MKLNLCALEHLVTLLLYRQNATTYSIARRGREYAIITLVSGTYVLQILPSIVPDVVLHTQIYRKTRSIRNIKGIHI